MIIIYHQNNKVVSIWNQLKAETVGFSKLSIAENLFLMAKIFPSSLVIWCHFSEKDNLNFAGIEEIFYHKKIMASYDFMIDNYLPDRIGYVEESPFININKNVQYPTWQMSSLVGGISSEVLNAVNSKIFETKNFDYYLVSLAKVLMPKGLLCYSAPSLLLNQTKSTNVKANSFQLFRFVKEHYRSRWVFLLFLNLLIFEKRIAFLPLITSFFYKQLKISENVLDTISIQSKNQFENKTIDVIIPTIGRKKYLYDVLCDFRNQTHLPAKIIIVEQNPIINSESELNYITEEVWPFKILHFFTHQSGACNARNIALSKISSEWVFLADDDIRFGADLLENAFLKMENFSNNAFTFACLRKEESLIYKRIFQWPTFGSGCSIVKKEALDKLQFDTKYEFGFGEDADFGMHLRNIGNDVIYLPNPQIVHLKAPIGGFRTKPKLLWQDDVVQPKPSPTVMLYKLLHLTPKQLLGYKTVLFFKFYKLQSVKNPVTYFKNFQKQWRQSVFWALKLK